MRATSSSVHRASLMVAVAVVGVGLGGEIYRRHLVAVASWHRAKAGMCRVYSETYKLNAVFANAELRFSEAFPDSNPNPPQRIDDKTIARHRRLAEFYQELAAKYDYATRYP